MKVIAAAIVERIRTNTPDFCGLRWRALHCKVERHEDALGPVQKPRRKAMMLHEQQPTDMIIPSWHVFMDGSGTKAKSLGQPVFPIAASCRGRDSINGGSQGPISPGMAPKPTDRECSSDRNSLLDSSNSRAHRPQSLLDAHGIDVSTTEQSGSGPCHAPPGECSPIQSPRHDCVRFLP